MPSFNFRFQQDLRFRIKLTAEFSKIINFKTKKKSTTNPSHKSHDIPTIKLSLYSIFQERKNGKQETYCQDS